MPSSRMTALLGLLAVAGYQNRHKLGELFQQATGNRGAGNQAESRGNPLAAAQAGAPQAGVAQAPQTSRGGGLLQGLLGGTTGPGAGMLGGLLAGAGSSPGGLLSGGLGELLERFRGNGQAQVADSWVSTGPNREIDAPQLEQALGEDTIQSLTQHTGLSRQELISRLQTVLPTAVDKLTPDGRVPNETEMAHWT